jgi:predicted metallo-beta-lactamase superfamily hydrolase
MTLVNKQVGAYCVVIEKQLAVVNCPLPKGTCVWKHRVTGQCRYDPSLSDIKVIDLAKLVGHSVPSEDQFLQTKAQLLEAVRAELKGA